MNSNRGANKAILFMPFYRSLWSHWAMQKNKTRPSVFTVSCALVLVFVIFGLTSPEGLAEIMQRALSTTITQFGWLYLIAMFCFFIFSVYLAFGRFGVIRLGGPDAEPEYSRSGWFAMLFAAGMGIGLVFWGAAEPVSHFASPPGGLTAQTPEAARAALRYSFFHWGFHPWAAYCVVGLALAFMQFNRNKPMLMSSIYDRMLSERGKKFFSGTIDTLAIIATAFGVATSLGFGALQIGAGFEKLFGLNSDLSLHIWIIAVTTGLYLTSALSGLDRGILFLSNSNLILALILVLLIFFAGPTAFILDSFTTTIGDYLNNLISMSMRMTPFSKRDWVANWTLFYWAWWVAWSPFVGLFIARISRGRTVREFVTGVLLMPSLACFLWFAVIGGTALNQIMFEQIPLVDVNTNDVSMTLFAMLEHLPLTTLTSIIAIALVSIFFVTSADSATFVLGMLSSDGDPNPGARVKLVWGLAISVISIVLLISGGLKGLQTMSIVTALPFMFLMVWMCVCLYQELNDELMDQIRRQKAKDKLLEKLLRESPQSG